MRENGGAREVERHKGEREREQSLCQNFFYQRIAVSLQGDWEGEAHMATPTLTLSGKMIRTVVIISDHQTEHEWKINQRNTMVSVSSTKAEKKRVM